MATTIEHLTLHSDPTVLRDALTKVATISGPKVTKVAVPLLGGVDALLSPALVQEKYGASIVPLIIGAGQPDATLVAATEQLGYQPVLIDVQTDDVQPWLPLAIQANADGATLAALSNYFIAQTVVQAALAHGCDAVMDGVGGGYLDAVVAAHALDLEVLPTLAVFHLTSAEMLALCEHFGVPLRDDESCTEHLLTAPVSQQITLAFENGIPVALDGEAMPLDALLAALHVIAGNDDVFAAQIVATVHADIERATLSQQQLQFKQQVDATWASLVASGGWLTSQKADLDAVIVNTQSVVQGSWTVSLAGGTIDIVTRQSTLPLFMSEVRTIAGEPSGGLAAYVSGVIV